MSRDKWNAAGAAPQYEKKTRVEKKIVKMPRDKWNVAHAAKEIWTELANNEVKCHGQIRHIISTTVYNVFIML